MDFSLVQVPLKLPIQLTWRCGPDMPFSMDSSVQSVHASGTVYVGGGNVDSHFSDNYYIVMAYDTTSGKWATLPPYQARWFAMTTINDQLVLVGGSGHDGGTCMVLGVWRKDSEEWIQPYPDMPTPRSSCSAVVYHHWLVVAGGWGADRRLSSVEVMNTDTKQWYAGPPAPIAWSSMKTAIAGDTCYFMGGWIHGGCATSKVYSISLPALVSQLKSARSAKDTQTWKELPQLPVTHAAPLSISGSLLAVGGMDETENQLNTFYLYQPDDARKWEKIAYMPTRRSVCTCVMTTNSEILVGGGWDDGPLATTEIATIQ